MTKNNTYWLKQHERDRYVKQATLEGYRSRAVYKLAQINARDHLFFPGMKVINLGAAPGGWCQWIKQHLGEQVHLFALDILPMLPLPGVTFIQGDFREQDVLDSLIDRLGQYKIDLVMSDMSPNISGIKATDQSKMIFLAELARDLALRVLAPGGHFLTKVFQGEGFDSYLKDLKPYFRQVLIRKPDASRNRSAEVYILAKHYDKTSSTYP